VLGALDSVALARQLDLEDLASWPDGEIRSGYLELSKERVTMLRLLPSGPGGTLNLVIAARWPGKEQLKPPDQYEIRVDIGMGVNPLVLRRSELLFVLDPDTSEATLVDLSKSLNIGGPGPAVAIERGTAMMPLADFIRLLRAEEVAGEIFGLEFTLTPKQVQAIRRFGDIIFKPSP
jgi:hypothetical protein